MRHCEGCEDRRQDYTPCPGVAPCGREAEMMQLRAENDELQLSLSSAKQDYDDGAKAQADAEAGRDTLRARLEAIKGAARGLLKVLPDSGRGEEWNWAWEELGEEAQAEVKAARLAARAALGKENADGK